MYSVFQTTFEVVVDSEYQIFPRLFINLYKILHSTEITHAIVSELPNFKQISHAIFLFKLYILKAYYLFPPKSNV